VLSMYCGSVVGFGFRSRASMIDCLSFLLSSCVRYWVVFLGFSVMMGVLLSIVLFGLGSGLCIVTYLGGSHSVWHALS